MEFRILGPLEVVDEAGRLVDLGRPKQRALLALLLISANRVEPLERLVELLWGEHAPSRAAGALQAYVSNLRRALEPQRAARAQAQVLVTQPPGYRLIVGPGQLDAARFEELAAEGHLHLVEGRPHAAHDALTTALGLWRGPALAEFATKPFAMLEAARLEGAKEAAEEDRLEAALAVGRHAQVVTELEVAVARAPLRERLWELLVLALYRSGRQGDALGAYERARLHLADELGIDPSPSLRRLEADILSQSESLDWRSRPDEAVTRPTSATPRTSVATGVAVGTVAGPGMALLGREPELGVLLEAFADAR
ncbi:MAG: hypothetical protein QOD63_2780, partial [Actinomycetota bacterium]|nr:hypothetical protein [Actinomycetota bacterium]